MNPKYTECIDCKNRPLLILFQFTDLEVCGGVSDPQTHPLGTSLFLGIQKQIYSTLKLRSLQITSSVDE